MRVDDSLVEFLLAKDQSPASRAWYTNRLGAFFAWAKAHDVPALADISAPPSICSAHQAGSRQRTDMLW